MPILFFAAVAACVIFAVSDEFHQSFIPSRTSSPYDAMIDVCGAFLGLAICWMFATGSGQKQEISPESFRG
jgi:VanZ family protein